jgi:hypothetical protein
VAAGAEARAEVGVISTALPLPVASDLLTESCPQCAGTLIAVGARRWCVRPYAERGCAGYWTLRGGSWRREAWHAPLVEVWS